MSIMNQVFVFKSRILSAVWKVDWMGRNVRLEGVLGGA